MLLLALLGAMMLVASPVIAHPGGATHGDKYWKNYYPNGYYNYCEPGGDNYYGATKANDEAWCDQWYTEYQKKKFKGEWYYYVHVYYKWQDPNNTPHTVDYWYYCRYHKYDDPNSTKPYFKAWVTHRPTGDKNWESFYWGSSQQ
jgi:hypothetical protein